ncbi:MAG: aminopeptidase N [Actinomycetales bacterium]|nr:aminopeptidase N [Actinomycetales bacterium]
MTHSENITRSEAKDRSALIDVQSYEVDLDVTTTGATFPSVTKVTFTCTSPGASTWIDLIAPAVRQVTLNGVHLDIAEVVQGPRITLPDLAAQNEVTVVADCAYMNTGEGLHRFVDPVDNETYLYTQFESADSRRMYASFEQPDLKATFQLTVRTPGHWQVVSNSPTPEPTVHEDGSATFAFAPTPRLSTYITALVAGPYHRVDDEYAGPHGTYPLGVYCRESLAPYLDSDEILTVTKQGFAYFEEQFGFPYPFAKYDQLFVPEFNAGAMENAGCVTILEDYVFRSRVTDAAYEQRANTILHELAHMWFGDLVTMTWWDDLWLNESFAEWAAHWANVNATRYTDAWTTFSNLRKAWAYRQDQLPSTHPIAADMVDLDAVRVNFDGITYAKGASALQQLVAWVGEEEFLAGVRSYFAKHAWGNTELRDLLVELEATSGRDLGAWTHEWLQTSGVNLLRPQISLGAYNIMTKVVIEQEPPTVPEGIDPTLRSHRVGIGLYDVKDGALTLRERIEVDVVGPLTEIPQLKNVMRPDLLLVNDGDLTFAKIRLDQNSWQTAVEHLGTLSDPLARALIWGAAWDMTRDGEVSTGDFLSLVLSGIGTETDIGVVQGVLRQLRTAIDFYATPEHRADYLARLADATRTLAEAAAPGSDHQLAFTRAFTSSASTPDQLDTVAALLDGSLLWDGLAVDTDLRWFLLQRLVITGRAQDTAIDDELASDDTATGRRQAAIARAARPTAEAKAQAWADIIDRTDLPNAILEATIGGFVNADQLDLLTPYRDRYFAVLAQVWQERTMEMAQAVTMGLYPALLIDEATLAATDAFLAQEGLNSACRRLVSEGRDGVVRAIRARATDAATPS